ncbi:TPA: alpha/beta hydrolase [Streptococcus suis]
MKKFIMNTLVSIGMFVTFLSLIIYIGVLGNYQTIISQIATVLFPLVAGPVLIAVVFIFFLAMLALWKNYRQKNKQHKGLVILALMSSFALLFGTVEWQQSKKIVEDNGGELTLLGDTSIPLTAKPDGYKTYANKENKDLTVSIYENGESYGDKPQPILVYIHGGGWASGDSESQSGFLRGMANRGYVVFSINYRLATDEDPTWEKATEDIADAMNWIKANASNYGGDSSRLILSGESAGGHLALLYTGLVTNGQLNTPKPNAVGVMYPAIDLKWTSKNGRYLSTEPIPNIVEKYIGGNLTEYQDRLAAVDPLNYISKELPPIYIIHGEKDTLVTVTGSEDYVEQVKAAGGQAELVSLPYSNHGVNLQASVSLITNFAESIDGLSVNK